MIEQDCQWYYFIVVHFSYAFKSNCFSHPTFHFMLIQAASMNDSGISSSISATEVSGVNFW